MRLIGTCIQRVLRGNHVHATLYAVGIHGGMCLSSLPRLWLQACRSTVRRVIILRISPREIGEDCKAQHSCNPFEATG